MKHFLCQKMKMFCFCFINIDIFSNAPATNICFGSDFHKFSCNNICLFLCNNICLFSCNNICLESEFSAFPFFRCFLANFQNELHRPLQGASFDGNKKIFENLKSFIKPEHFASGEEILFFLVSFLQEASRF